MKRPGLVALIIGTAAISGCGGGSTEDTQPSAGTVPAGQTATTTADRRDAASRDDAEIRALVERYVSAYKAGDWEVVCDSLAPSARQQIAVAMDALSDSEVSCPESFAGLAKTDPIVPSVEITSVKVTGDSAVAPEADTTDGTSDLRFERVDGRWLVGIDDDGTSNDTGAALRERVKAWPATWCKLDPGATQREIRDQMGKPTETFDGQDSWSGYGTSLTAFYGADMAAYQLQANNGTLPCERTRKAAGRD